VTALRRTRTRVGALVAVLVATAAVAGPAAGDIHVTQKALSDDPNYTISDWGSSALNVSVTPEAPDFFGTKRYAIKETAQVEFVNLSSNEDFCEADLFSGLPFQWTRWVCRYLSRVTVDLADLDDRFTAPDVDTRFTVEAGTGNDYVATGVGLDVIRGGAGNDSLWGGGNDDSLDGGDGNDMLGGGAGSDTIAGGPGSDTASYSSSAVGVTVTLNGLADDGGSGEGDNVATSVEHVNGGPKNDRLTGRGTANTLRGNAGNDTLRGEGGSDTLVGGDGDDRLVGGSGADRLEGNGGADVIDAAGDGSVDTILCGGGTDVVHADPTDRVDLGTCEVVE